MKMIKRLFSMVALLTLAACGGGGGDPGASGFGPGASAPGGGASSSGGSAASDLVLVLSSATISTTGAQTITATATALDANRNALADVPVTISVDSGAVATASGSATSPSGTVTAAIGVGSDNSPRTITVTASSGSLSRTAPLLVQSGANIGGQASLTLALSSTSISSAVPATVTATLKDAQNAPIAGQVVTFNVVRGLAGTNVGTALTATDGTAVAVLTPTSPTGAGADEVTASATAGGAALQVSRGFTVQATNVTINSFTSAVDSLSAYGQTSLMVGLSGASVGSPVQVTVSSACVAAGKASLSPAAFSATTAVVTLQYRDVGCGALQVSDILQAVVDGTANSRALSLPIASPAVSSLAFISSMPEQIFIRGSGFAESSTVIFEVRDANGSPLPNVGVSLRLLTQTGGVTMEGGTANLVRASDAAGRITLRVNSGTQPTPVRIAATIVGSSISTVSSNLSIAVGLPSQLNFSMSQGTRNIEGYTIDGTMNSYQIIASDRNGNPVPAGTSINFITEGGQIEAIKQIQISGGIARTSANFVSSEPRPVDGRVTVTTYALGEESFIDLNGNNIYDLGEPFQDLGSIFKDRNYNGIFESQTDEFIPLAVNNDAACAAAPSNLLSLNPGIPTVPATCDGVWSGAGQVYVRRALETVLSTSSSRPLWGDTSGLCAANELRLQIGPEVSQTGLFYTIGASTWYGSNAGTLAIIASDSNPGRKKPVSNWGDPLRFNPLIDYEIFPRLNPLAAGTTITASTPTPGFVVQLNGGTPIPSSGEATFTSVGYSFNGTSTTSVPTSGIIFISFTSPSGLVSTTAVTVTSDPKPSTCPL